MKPTLYPTLEEVLALHARLIERFGGAEGVRDLGLIQSALMRPRSGYYESLSAEAAALMQSFACNHGFVDGNKRVSFALTAIFLRMNGFRLIVEPDNGESFLIEQVIEQKVEVKVIALWLEQQMKKA